MATLPPPDRAPVMRARPLLVGGALVVVAVFALAVVAVIGARRAIPGALFLVLAAHAGWWAFGTALLWREHAGWTPDGRRVRWITPEGRRLRRWSRAWTAGALLALGLSLSTCAGVIP